MIESTIPSVAWDFPKPFLIYVNVLEVYFSRLFSNEFPFA
jgi:hypothetical protein